MKLNERKCRLEEMHILDSREKFNSQAASLRTRGLTTVHIWHPGLSDRRFHAALQMKEVVEKWTENVTQNTVAENRSTKIMDWLVNCMDSM